MRTDYIEMSNFYGDAVTILENEDGTAQIISDGKEKHFDSFEQAYNAAYKRGYRE